MPSLAQIQPHPYMFCIHGPQNYTFDSILKNMFIK